MKNKTDPRIDKFISELPDWKRNAFQTARKLVHEADPEVEETIKRTKFPYFILNGNICAFMAAKDHVNIFIYDPIASDPNKIINQGEGNKTARAIQIYEGDKINEKALLQLFKDVIKNNKAGGWRKIQKATK